MINAGSALCLKCGNILTEAYYFNSSSNAWVRLKKSGRKNFSVEEFIPSSKSRTGCTGFSLNKNHKADVSIMSDTIHVDFFEKGERAENKQFHRCCPECNGSEVFSKFGLLPTYVIAVIGARTVGKTSWIKALSKINNQNKLLRRTYPYCIDSARWEIDFKLIKATDLNDMGSTNLLTISKRGTRHTTKKAVANVLMLDFAGELFASTDKIEDKQTRVEEYDRMCRLLRGTHDYNGADAVVFMDAPNSQFDPVVPYNSVKELGVLEKKPVAYVVNKVDMMFDNPPKVSLPGSDAKTDLFTSDTFAHNADADIYKKSEIVPRVMLETYLASKYNELAHRILTENPHSAGFFIQTTDAVTDETSDDAPERHSDTGSDVSINVLDPIIWLLNELDIFPIL